MLGQIALAPDFFRFPYSPLRALSERVSQQIQQRGQEEIVKAREQIRAIAESVGVPVHELLGKQGGKQGGKTGPVAARYRNPADASQQWSGRGRQPLWVKELIASGGHLDNAKI